MEIQETYPKSKNAIAVRKQRHFTVFIGKSRQDVQCEGDSDGCDAPS
jgi:hypothetical protein